MIRLSQIMEQVDQGVFYDWTRDFDLFKNSINSATQSAKSRIESALKSKVLNKSVVIHASKAQPRQPVKDYTINRVTNVYMMDYSDEWVVVFKDEFEKEFCLVPGFKIKIIGSGVSLEPGSANAPEQEPPTIPATPMAKPTRPVKTNVPKPDAPSSISQQPNLK